MADLILERVVPALSQVPGVVAVVLGGSRAKQTATVRSDYDLGLYYGSEPALDTDKLLEAVRGVVDHPDAASITPVGDWGPWIVGGGWLQIDGRHVDLLYRSDKAVAKIIRACRAGHITLHYQPGHPHCLCSATWMGEVALCQPLHDPQGIIDEMKAMTLPYPEPLRQALIRQFQWEVLFSIQMGESGIPRGEQSYIAGCTYRALACIGQVLFALNKRYLINEKGALNEATLFPVTISWLPDRVAAVWGALGRQEFVTVFDQLRALEFDLRSAVEAVE
jgi:hypothetical protein